MHYVYVLISNKDGNHYVGSTSDLRRRMAEHARGKVKSTMYRRPLALLCYEAYHEKSVASARERFLKTSDGKKDLRKRFGRLAQW